MQVLNHPTTSNFAAQDASSGSNGSDSAAGIDQLVQVNSLQQLIQINQDLGGASGTSSDVATAPSSGSPSVSSQAIGAASRLASSMAPKTTQPATSSDVHPALQSRSVASPKPAVHKA
jgi:flagellar basal-body rod modification protein FlgD